MALQWTTNRQFTAPSAAAGVSITPNAVAWTNSPWVQLVAFSDAVYLLTSIIVNPGVDAQFEIEIGVGGAGSEVPIATVRGSYTTLLAARGAGHLHLPYPVDLIPFGSRIAARLRKSGTDTTAWSCAMTFFKKPLTGILELTTKAYKCQPSAAAGITLNSNTTAWTFGTYGELWSAAAATVLITGLCVESTLTCSFELEIATGAAASEVVIGRFYGDNVAAAGPRYTPLFNPMASTDAGERVAARWRKSGTSATTATLAVTYVELPL